MRRFSAELDVPLLLLLPSPLIPTNPPRRERTFGERLRADPLSSRLFETRLSCPLRMSAASKASTSRDDDDGDDEVEAKNPVIAELSLITSNAAEMGATKGPDVSARSAIWGT